MTERRNQEIRDGERCRVVGGTHAGKSGIARDVRTSKTGHVTITVVQADGERFKTLARNVVVQPAEIAEQGSHPL
jgi:ribosomal protein S4E